MHLLRFCTSFDYFCIKSVKNLYLIGQLYINGDKYAIMLLLSDLRDLACMLVKIDLKRMRVACMEILHREVVGSGDILRLPKPQLLGLQLVI